MHSKAGDCFLHKDFIHAAYIHLISHTEVLGGDECEKKEGDALKQHIDESVAESTNIMW